MARRLRLMMVGLVAAGTVVVAGAQSAANKPVRLRLKFADGQRFDYQVDQKMTQTIEGQEGESSSTQTLNVAWQVRSVDDEGVADVSFTLGRMRFTIAQTGGPGGQADSAKQNQEGPLADAMAPLFDAIIGKPLLMKIHPTGKITDVQLPQGMAAQLKNAAAGQLAALFSEDFLKQVIQQLSPDFSAKPVSIGQTWTASRETTIPIFGKQTAETTYKYEGLEKRGDRKLAKISPQVEVAFAPAKDAHLAVDILKQSSSGTIYLDVEAGKLMESDVKSTMRMNVTYMGNKFTQELTATTTIKPTAPRKTPPRESSESKTTEETAGEPEEK